MRDIAYGDTPARGGGNFYKNEHCRSRARIRNSKKTVAKFTAPIGLAEQLSALTFERTCDFGDMYVHYRQGEGGGDGKETFLLN